MLFSPLAFSKSLEKSAGESFSNGGEGASTKKTLSFVISPCVTILNGTLDEFVFSDYADCGMRKLSELNWYLENVFYIGADLSLALRVSDALTFLWGVGGQGAIPRETQAMKDSDWFNPSDESMKVCYSESDCDLTASCIVRTSFSSQFRIKEWFTISPLATVEYRYYTFSTSDTAELWYGNVGGSYYPYNDSHACHYKKGDKTGIKIDLARHEFYTFLGADFAFHPVRGLTLSHSLALSPFFFTISFDHHHDGARYYLDKVFSAFKAFDFTTAISYDFNRYLGLKFLAQYSLALLSKGASGQSVDDSGALNSYEFASSDDSRSGSASEVYSFTLSLVWRVK